MSALEAVCEDVVFVGLGLGVVDGVVPAQAVAPGMVRTIDALTSMASGLARRARQKGNRVWVKGKRLTLWSREGILMT